MKLYIHIGHGKTGTSAIQAALATHVDKLKQIGILYPVAEEARKEAASLKVTSGNITHRDPSKVIPRLASECLMEANVKAVVLSNENLFWTIDSFFECIPAMERRVEVIMILVVRNLDEMVSSEYQQHVKRHGESRSFEQFLSDRQYISPTHERACRLLQIVKEREIELKILNYSKAKRAIVPEFFRLIGAESVLGGVSCPIAKVNRSLTREELDILTVINRLYSGRYPQISQTISDDLIHRLPSLEGHQLNLSQAAKTALAEVNEAYVNTINSFLSPADNVVCLSPAMAPGGTADSPTANHGDEQELTSVELIADTLLSFLHARSLPALSRDAVQAIIERAGSAGLSNSIKIELLQLAALYRPNGIILKRRLRRLLESSRS